MVRSGGRRPRLIQRTRLAERRTHGLLEWEAVETNVSNVTTAPQPADSETRVKQGVRLVERNANL